MLCSWNNQFTISWEPAFGYIACRFIMASQMVLTVWPCCQVCWSPRVFRISWNLVILILYDMRSDTLMLYNDLPKPILRCVHMFLDLFCQVQVYSGKGSGQVRTKTDGGQRSEVWAEVSPGWSCNRLDSTTRTMSIDPLCRFWSGGDGDRDRQGDRSSNLDDFRLKNTG